MSKATCSICNDKTGFFNKAINVSDGMVCQKCWVASGKSMTKQSLSEAMRYSTSELRGPYDLKQEHIKLIDQFKTTQAFGDTIRFDDNLEAFMVNGNLYKYADIMDFEFRENGVTTVTKGGLGKALLGGAIAGGVGAIVGASIGGKKEVRTIKSMDVIIRLNKSYVPSVIVPIFTQEIKSTSMFYNTFVQYAEGIVTKLMQITNE